MIDGLKPYSAYMDTDLNWLGQIPAHWFVRRLGQTVRLLVSNVDKHTIDGELPIRLCNYVDVYKNDLIRSDRPFMKASARPAEVSRFRLRAGDVLITKDSEDWRDIAVPALVASGADDLVCGYHVAMLRPEAGKLHGAYLHRCLQSEPIAWQFRVAANGVTRYGLSHGAIKDALIPIAPPEEQAAIVRFLDHVDRRIRRYIRAKRQLIALLNEQKQAIIHRAVTRGLDPNVRLKPSGVEWLGDVPVHWENVRLKDFARVQTGVTLGKHYGSVSLVERPYLRVANVQTGRLDLSTVKTISVPPAELKRSALQPGDVLMTEGGDIDKLGRGCVWRGEIDDCLHQNHIFAVRPNQRRLLPDFLVLLTASRHGRCYFEITAKRTTNLASTNSTTLGVFPFMLPSPEEQQQILDALSKETRSLAVASNRAECEIELLREYRTRLIADVVTGKLDVREAAARLPDEQDEPEALDDEPLEVDEAAADARLDAEPEEVEA